MIVIGIDNGVTGSIGIVGETIQPEFYPVPVKTELSYTKKKQYITRIDIKEFKNILLPIVKDYAMYMAVIERPMVNPGRFKASMSAMRSLEAVLVVLERFCFPYRYIDSKEWQKEMLPAGLKDKELKKASLDIGCRLFPSCRNEIIKQKDADGLLIAEYARKQYE